MKRVRCPKCDNFLTFDETKYTEGQSLVFICDKCKKQFSIRIGNSKLRNTQKEEKIDEESLNQDFGSIVVLENVFGFKQAYPLHEGENVIGRRNKGTEVDIPIETADPSMDRKHCVIHVKRNKNGVTTYTLRDNQSLTGTFYMNDILGDKEQVRIDDGSVVTLGATTIILHAAEKEE